MANEKRRKRKNQSNEVESSVNDDLLINQIVELGIGSGKSLIDFAAKNPNIDVIGLDNIPRKLINMNNIRSYICDQSDVQTILNVFMKYKLNPDIFVDNGSHIWSHQINTFKAVYPLLKSGAIYTVKGLETSFSVLWRDQDEKPIDFFSEIEGCIINTEDSKLTATIYKK
jgi:hypothetical protein